MTNESLPESLPTPENTPAPAPEAVEEPAESFADLLTAYEQAHSHKAAGAKQLQGTVVSITAGQVFDALQSMLAA